MDAMGKLNQKVVITRREGIRNSALGSILGILMLGGAYYYFPMGRGFIHNRVVVRLGGMGIFFAVVSVWAFVRSLKSK